MGGPWRSPGSVLGGGAPDRNTDRNWQAFLSVCLTVWGCLGSFPGGSREGHGRVLGGGPGRVRN